MAAAPQTDETGSFVSWHPGPVPHSPDESSRQAADRVVGRRFGIVRDCVPVPWSQGLPPVAVYAASGPQQMPGWSIRIPPDGTGVSQDPEAARLAAIAETVEAYCALAPADPRLLVRASFTRLRERAVEPAALRQLSDKQYEQFPDLHPLTEDKVVDWCWAFSLTQQRAVRIPAAFVHWSLGIKAPNNFVAEQLSTGFAAHVSPACALLAGLCEVLERDALTIAWHTGLPFTPLGDDGTGGLEALTALFTDCEMSCELFRVPTDGPFPVVLAVAGNPRGEPYAVVGAACRPDSLAAATKAAYEAGQALFRFRDQGPQPPAQVRTLEDHAALYATDADAATSLYRRLRSPAASQELPAAATPAPDSVDGAIETAVAALAHLDLEVLVTETTTPDVAAAGYRALRVLVPGVVDMAVDDRFHPLGTQRLYEVPTRLGLQQHLLDPADLEPLPVPLA